MNTRCRDLESQALEFSGAGHSILLLTQNHKGYLHENFDRYGFYSEAKPVQSKYFLIIVLKHISNLIGFCRVHKVDVVYSHLEPCNLIAVLAQFFVLAKVVICRHHADALWMAGDKKNYCMSKIIYNLARQIIVVSPYAKRWMVQHEKISSDKIHVIPLSYNFNLYELPEANVVSEVREQFNAKLLLITAARFIRTKRLSMVIEVCAKICKQGIDVKLIILGDGEMRPQLLDQVHALNLESRIFFMGHVTNVLPYIAAADLYVHLSESEASCITVKEAGYLGKPVLVCRGVGDFEDYLTADFDAFLIDKNDPIKEAVSKMKVFYESPQRFTEMGVRLKKKVTEYFDIKNVIPLYQKINSRLTNDTKDI